MPDLFFDPTVTLFAPDHRIDQRGYLKRWYPNEPELRERSYGDLWVWPGLNQATLAPKYIASLESGKVNWGDTGGGTYADVTGLWGDNTGKTIVQQNATLGASTLTATFTTGINQAFFLDFYLYMTYANTWYMDFKFAARHLLRFLYNGVIQLWRNFAYPGQTEKWVCVQSCDSFDSIFNEHLRLTVYVTANQEILIVPWGFKPLTWIDPDPAVIDLGDGTELIQTTEPFSPILYVTSGAYYFSWRRMSFATTGTWLLPEMSLPWAYEGTFTLSKNISFPRNITPPTMTFEIVDAAGSAISSPPADLFTTFYPKLTITGSSDAVSPEINWLQMYIEPTAKVHAPTPIVIPAGGRLLDLTTDSCTDGPRTVAVDIQNMDAGATSMLAKRNVCMTVEVGGTKLFEGYLDCKEGSEENSGMIRTVRKGIDNLKRLKIPLSDAYIGDDEVHTAFIEALFKYCGLVPESGTPGEEGYEPGDYIIDVDPEAKKLPAARGVKEPLFQARDGKLVEEMVTYIREIFSGWDLHTEMDGRIHYALPPTTYTPEVELVGEGDLVQIQQSGVNLPRWKYFELKDVEDEAEFFNYIVVIGEDYTGMPIIASYYNGASVDDEDDSDYLGYEKLLIYIDTNLKTAILVEDALEIVKKWQAQLLTAIEVEAAFAYFKEFEVDRENEEDPILVTTAQYPDMGQSFKIKDRAGAYLIVSLERRFEPPSVRASLAQIPTSMVVEPTP